MHPAFCKYAWFFGILFATINIVISPFIAASGDWDSEFTWSLVINIGLLLVSAFMIVRTWRRGHYFWQSKGHRSGGYIFCRLCDQPFTTEPELREHLLSHK